MEQLAFKWTIILHDVQKKSFIFKSLSIFHKPPVDLVYQKADQANTSKFKGLWFT